MTSTAICKTCRSLEPAPSAYGLEHGCCQFCGTFFRGGDNLDASGPYHTAHSHDWGCKCGTANRYRDHACVTCGAAAPFAAPGLVGLPDDEQEFARWLNATDFGRNTECNPWAAWEDLAGDAYDMAVLFAEPQDPDHVNGLLAYFFEGEFAGEFYPDNCPALDGRLFVPYVDSTKSRRDDVGDAMGPLWDHIRNGSPVRKTSRAGAGTKGTQKWAGVSGPFWVAFR